MITIVDKGETASGPAVVQKISKPNGKLVRYQVVTLANVGNAAEIKVFMTLQDARIFIGKVVAKATA